MRPKKMQYFCKECGELHEHEEFLFGSPVDYGCKKKKKEAEQ